jgi:hypothetical protein
MAKAAFLPALTVLRESEVLAKVRSNYLSSRRVIERLGMSIIRETVDVPDAAPSLIYAQSAADYRRLGP